VAGTEEAGGPARRTDERESEDRPSQPTRSSTPRKKPTGRRRRPLRGIISPEPHKSLRTMIAAGGRSGVVDMAQHLWHSGWKEEVQPAGLGIGWARFLKLVREKWFLFQGWANGTATWKDTEERLLEIARQVLRKEMG